MDPAEAQRFEVAFLQYTSGSTSDPSGVLVTHDNLRRNAEAIASAEVPLPSRVGVCWLPTFHDFGLIGGVLQSIYYATRMYLSSPIDFLKQPLSWLKAISRYRATHTAAPNFAFELCIRKFNAEACRGLDLSSLKIMCNAAEPIRRATLDRFTELYRPFGFSPKTFVTGYGLAEATLYASGNHGLREPLYLNLDSDALARGRVSPLGSGPADGAGRWLVGLGPLAPGLKAAVVNPDTREVCAADQVGELWLQGGQVASGYWNRPERTEEIFRATDAAGDGPWLRTGDLGFFCEGQLFVTGRRKDLIILYGRNHYPQDLEASVEQAHPQVRSGCVAAFAIDGEDGERLCIAAEVSVERDPPLSSVRSAIVEAVAAAHEVRVHEVALLAPGTIPKTSSGKIQRSACRQALVAGQLEVLR